MQGKIYIEDEKQLQFIRNVGDFEDLLSRKIGQDALDYFKNYLKSESFTKDCTGECDRLYSLQEHYEQVLQDAVNEMKGWNILKETKCDLIEKRDDLVRQLNAEL